MNETSVQTLLFFILFHLILKIVPSFFPLISAHFPSCLVVCQGDCRVPPHSCLALMSGHSWGGAGISQSRLQRRDRHWQPRTLCPSAASASERTIIYYLHWCEKQLLSLWRHIVPSLLHSVRFPPQVCMFGFGWCSGGMFPPSFCLIHRNCPSLQIIFQKARRLEIASHFFPLLYLISVILLHRGGVYRPTEEDLTMQPASVLKLPLSNSKRTV